MTKDDDQKGENLSAIIRETDWDASNDTFCRRVDQAHSCLPAMYKYIVNMVTHGGLTLGTG